MTQKPEVQLANDILDLCEEYDREGLEGEKCVDAVGVARQELIELGWDK